jgi:hypothetical protein
VFVIGGRYHQQAETVIRQEYARKTT